uniref:TSA: Wollemia nobilis Ref_Wollemi_Transcript_16723_1211 transcribed RNA sequence n=1 Tax=Wollemia nobilis TaxID=56998 RepID=A0A0C9QNH5_9CONI
MGNTREVEIGDRTLVIHEQENITDPLTGKEAAGCWIWDCSLVLAHYLATPSWPPAIFHAKTVIELGAGTGIPGLTAALLGANVVLTDAPPLLPGLQKNVDQNQLGDKVRVRPLTWGEELDFGELSFSPPVDFVLMSDLLYDVKAMPGLCKTLREITGRNTEILLAYELRYGTTECFSVLREEGFRCFKVPQEELDPTWQSDDIGIFRVRSW